MNGSSVYAFIYYVLSCLPISGKIASIRMENQKL